MTPEQASLVLDNLALVAWTVRRCAWGLSPDKYDDLLQAGVLGLIRAARSYDGRGSFATWAPYHIRREVQDVIRRADRAWTNCGDALEDVPDHRPCDPIELAMRAERDRVVRLAVQRLPAREREIILRRYLDGGDHQEDVGRSWGVSKQRVSQLEERALSRLREYLREYDSG